MLLSVETEHSPWVRVLAHTSTKDQVVGSERLPRLNSAIVVSSTYEYCQDASTPTTRIPIDQVPSSFSYTAPETNDSNTLGAPNRNLTPHMLSQMCLTRHLSSKNRTQLHLSHQASCVNARLPPAGISSQPCWKWIARSKRPTVYRFDQKGRERFLPSDVISINRVLKPCGPA